MFQQNAYYPYRAVKDRPYFKDFEELPREKRSWERLVQSALFGTLSCFGPRGETRDDPVAHVCGMNEAKLSDMLAHFFMDGQAIFHIAKPLRDAFLNSDLGDATPGDLRLPFRTLYVHLGGGLDLPFNEGATVLEGALLQETRVSVGCPSPWLAVLWRTRHTGGFAAWSRSTST
jgi:hypothetical protein